MIGSFSIFLPVRNIEIVSQYCSFFHPMKIISLSISLGPSSAHSILRKGLV